MSTLTIEKTQEIINEVLSVYPEKTRKKRAKHLQPNDPGCSTCGVKSNIKSIPGVMTARGCAYAGSKGVVWGPVKDMIHVSHGPVGCAITVGLLVETWLMACTLLRTLFLSTSHQTFRKGI